MTLKLEIGLYDEGLVSFSPGFFKIGVTKEIIQIQFIGLLSYTLQQCNVANLHVMCLQTAECDNYYTSKCSVYRPRISLAYEDCRIAAF